MPVRRRFNLPAFNYLAKCRLQIVIIVVVDFRLSLLPELLVQKCPSGSSSAAHTARFGTVLFQNVCCSTGSATLRVT